MTPAAYRNPLTTHPTPVTFTRLRPALSGVRKRSLAIPSSSATTVGAGTSSLVAALCTPARNGLPLPQFEQHEQPDLPSAAGAYAAEHYLP